MWFMKRRRDEKALDAAVEKARVQLMEADRARALAVLDDLRRTLEDEGGLRDEEAHLRTWTAVLTDLAHEAGLAPDAVLTQWQLGILGHDTLGPDALRLRGLEGQARDFVHTVQEGLRSGGKVPVPGFGTFSVSTRRAYCAVDPRTGREQQIPAHYIPVYRPARAFREHLDGTAPWSSVEASEPQRALIRAMVEHLLVAEPARSVYLPGLGVFILSARSAFGGLNPRNGERLSVPARVLPVFRPDLALKNMLNPNG